MRRGARRADGFHDGPRPAAVRRTGDRRRERIVDADCAEQRPVVQFDDMRLVAFVVDDAVRQGDGSEQRPILAFVVGDGGLDGRVVFVERLDAIDVQIPLLAEIEPAAVLQDDEAVGRVDRGLEGLAPIFAVGADADPRADIAVDHAVRPRVHDGAHLLAGFVPPCFGVLKLLIIEDGIGCKPRQRKTLAAKGDDACVTVVQRRVVDDGRRGPCGAVVMAFADDGTAPWADMLVAEAGGGHNQRPVVLPGDGWPAEIAEFFLRHGTNDA